MPTRHAHNLFVGMARELSRELSTSLRQGTLLFNELTSNSKYHEGFEALWMESVS